MTFEAVLFFFIGLISGWLLSFPHTVTNPTSTMAENTPAAGELWLFQPNDNSPWGTKNVSYAPVKVLAASDGWVRYAMGNTFPDERMTSQLFCSMYRKLA